MRVRSMLPFAFALPLVACAIAACGGDSEAPLFGASLGGSGGLGGASGALQGGRAGGSGAGASGGGTAGTSGSAGGSGAAGKAGAGGGSSGGAAGKAGGSAAGASGAGASGAAGKSGASGKGGAGGTSGGGAAGAAGNSTFGGSAGAAGKAGAGGLGGSAGNGGVGGNGGSLAGAAGSAGEAGTGGVAGTGGAALVCGDGLISGSEKCDGKSLGGASCESLIGPGTVGALGCRVDCSFDTSGCGVCGNGKVDPGEECEKGPNVAADRCSDDCRIQCPAGGQAFQGHCYWRDDAFRTLDNARKECEAKQGHLVTIGSKEENAFVDTQVIGSSVFDHWLALTDTATEGTFVWMTKEPLGYTNWTGNEPDNFLGQDCAVMAASGRWQDEDCGSFKNAVCELDDPLKK